MTKAVRPHLVAQQAIVRMLVDDAFAARVREDAAAALPELPPSLRAQLAGIDPRALKLDRFFRRRILRNLFDEYKASTTIFLSRVKRLAVLDDFFADGTFLDVVANGCPLAFAYSRFLVARDATLADVVAIEHGLAAARRMSPSSSSPSPSSSPPRDGRVHRAAGVQPITTSHGALAALQQAERYLFEVGLMPAVALVDDAPPLVLDARTHDATPLYLVAVPTESGHSLVTVDRALHDLVASLPQPMTPALQPLVDDELAVRT